MSTVSSPFVVGHHLFCLVRFLGINYTFRPVKCGSWDQYQELASPSAWYHLVLGKRELGLPLPPFHP